VEVGAGVVCGIEYIKVKAGVNKMVYNIITYGFIICFAVAIIFSLIYAIRASKRRNDSYQEYLHKKLLEEKKNNLTKLESSYYDNTLKEKYEESKRIALQDLEIIKDAKRYDNDRLYYRNTWMWFDGVETRCKRIGIWIIKAETEFVKSHQKEILELATEMCEKYAKN
jgi:ABC-type maltose transport system permease subunit